MTKRPSITVNFKRRDRSARADDLPEAENPTAVIFQGEPGRKNQTFDFAKFAIKRPEMTTAFCLFFRVAGEKISPASRKNVADAFGHFVDFLESYEGSFRVVVVSLSDLTTRITRGYGDWLDGDKHIGSSLALSAHTKNTRYRIFMRFIKYCQRATRTRGSIPQALGFRERWETTSTSRTTKNSLSITEVARLREACKASIDVTRRRLARSSSVVSDPSLQVPDLYSTTSVIPFLDADVRLKAAAKAFEINRLSGTFQTTMKGLARSLRQPYGEIGAMVEELYLTVQSLIAFMVMIGLMTCFNEIGLLTLKLSNLKRGHGILGDPRLFVIGLKPRAGRHQRRSFPIDPDDPYCMDSLVATVQRYTDGLRRHVGNEFADTLFIAARSTGHLPGGFFSDTNTVPSSVTKRLKAFLVSSEIPEFSLNDLRTIGADIGAMMSAGDIKVQQLLLNHGSIKTTYDHYETYQAARARQENLGHLMNERERFITSGGRIDPRNAGSSVGLYRAATPGIDCLDAMNSPVRGQRPGTLCSAYGKCFSCPRAVLFPTLTNAARLLQVRLRFEEARAKINASRWKLEWEKEYLALSHFWLLLFPVDVIRAVREIELSPIPSIE